MQVKGVCRPTENMKYRPSEFDLFWIVNVEKTSNSSVPKHK